MNYKISTIIPVYNSEKTIQKCIDSLLNQTYKNIEIIVMDDGSTDNSISIVEDIIKKDNRVRLYKLKHVGGGIARNIGIDKATGDLIHFLDSDDYIDINAYSIVVDEFLKNEKCDVCMFSYYRVDTTNNTIQKRKITDKKIETSLKASPEFLIRCDPQPWAKIVKTDLIKKNSVRFDITSFGHDTLFHFGIIKYAKDIIILPEQLVFYTINNPKSLSGILTRSKNYSIHFQHFDRCIKLYDDLPKNIYCINICWQFERCVNFYQDSLEEYKLNNYFIIRDFIIKLDDKLAKAILSNPSSKQKYYEIMDFSYIKSVIGSKENEIQNLKNEISMIKNSRSYKLATKLAKIKRKLIKTKPRNKVS